MNDRLGLPVKVLGEKMRWMDACVHGKDVHDECAECDELTRQAQEMFAPAEGVINE